MLILWRFFLQSLKGLNDQYTNFFDNSSGEDNKGSGDGFSDRWGWWCLIDNLTNSRVDKWEIVTKWNVIHGLNICSYYKDKQRKEKIELEKIGR